MTVVVLAKVIGPDELPLAKSWYVPDGLNVVVPLDVCVMYEADVKKATLCAAGMTVVVTVFDVNEVAVAVIGTVPKVVPVRTMLAIPFWAATIPRPPTAPVPPAVAKVTPELYAVTVLAKLSLTTAVAVQVELQVRFPEQPLRTICVAGPEELGEKPLLVFDVKPPDEAVMLYEVPTTPPNVHPATMTTPVIGTRFVHEASEPADETSEIAPGDVVTTLPAESSTFTTGWVVITESDAPATGWVVKANWVGAPGSVGEKLALMIVRAPCWAVRVNGVPTIPAKVQVETVTTPLTGVKFEQSCRTPFDDDVSDIAPVDAVTTRPTES
jgi:hypothetical protein